MSEVTLGQRELNAECTLESFSAEELELIGKQGASMLLDVVKASGAQTVNAALGELAQNAAAGLAASAKPEKSGEETAKPSDEKPADEVVQPKEGDICTLEDGSEGVLVKDGENLVCSTKPVNAGEQS